MLIDEFKAQVVFLMETKIDGPYPNCQFAIERYKIYRFDRKKGAVFWHTCPLNWHRKGSVCHSLLVPSKF